LKKLCGDRLAGAPAIGAFASSVSNLKFTTDLAEAIAGADLFHERGERIDFKQKLYGQLDELLSPDVIIASSSSGLTLSEIQMGAASPHERCVITPSVQSAALDPSGRDRRRGQDFLGRFGR